LKRDFSKPVSAPDPVLQIYSCVAANSGMVFRMRHTRLLSVLCAAAFAAASGACAKRDPAGITLALSTDVIVPEDIDAVALVFTDAANGRVIGAPIVRPAAPSTDGRAVRFPSTITLQTAFEDDAAGFGVASDRRVVESVQIALIGLKKDAAVTLRRIVTAMPTDGVHLLRVAIPYLDLGGASGNAAELGLTRSPALGASLQPASYGIGAITSVCGVDQDRVDGVCSPIENVRGDELPLFDPRKIFGGAAAGTDPMAACFDAASCFATGSNLDIFRDASGRCVAPAPVGDFALALTRPSASPNDAQCVLLGGEARCLAPLDAGVGYSLQGGSIVLSEGICGAFARGQITGVVVGKGASCNKAPEIPICGPSSSVQNANNRHAAVAPLDAGPPVALPFAAVTSIGTIEPAIVDVVPVVDGEALILGGTETGDTQLSYLRGNTSSRLGAWGPLCRAKAGVGRIFPVVPANATNYYTTAVSVALSECMGLPDGDYLFRVDVNAGPGPAMSLGPPLRLVRPLTAVTSITQGTTTRYFAATADARLCAGTLDDIAACANAAVPPFVFPPVLALLPLTGAAPSLFAGTASGHLFQLDPSAVGAAPASAIGAPPIVALAAGATQGYALRSADATGASSSIVSYSLRSPGNLPATVPVLALPEPPAAVPSSLAPPTIAVVPSGGVEHLFVSASDGLRVYTTSGRRLPNLIPGTGTTIGAVKALNGCVYAAVGANTPGLRPGLWKSCALAP
jgi:hypothetical protein